MSYEQIIKYKKTLKYIKLFLYYVITLALGLFATSFFKIPELFFAIILLAVLFIFPYYVRITKEIQEMEMLLEIYKNNINNK